MVDAIRLADDFAKGLPCPTVESVVREVEASRAVVEGEFLAECDGHDCFGGACGCDGGAAPSPFVASPCNRPCSGPPRPIRFLHLADVTADLAAGRLHGG